jgi:hypothetical protein
LNWFGVVGGSAGVAAALGVAAWATRRWVTAAIDGAVRIRVGSELARLEHGLRMEHSQHMAALDRSHSREHAAYVRFTARQHAVYRRLYDRFRTAQGALIQPATFMAPDFSKLGERKLRDMAAESGVDEETLRSLLKILPAEAMRFNSLFFRAMLDEAQPRGLKAFRDARNYAVANDIYLSDPVRTAVGEVADKMAEYAVDLLVDDRSRTMAMHQIGEAVPPLFQALRIVMRDEMRGSASSVHALYPGEGHKDGDE